LPGDYIGDAIRNITGSFDYNAGHSALSVDEFLTVGAFYAANPSQAGYFSTNETKTGKRSVGFDVSRVVPTAHENRPASISFAVYASY
jgi:hypothetical protein